MSQRGGNASQEYWRNQRNQFTTYASKNVMSLLQAKFHPEIMSQIWRFHGEYARGMSPLFLQFRLYIWRHAIDKSHTGLEKRRILFQKETELTQDEESSPPLFISHYVILWKIQFLDPHQLRCQFKKNICRILDIYSHLLDYTYSINLHQRAWLPWPDIFLTKLQFHSPSPMQISTKGITRRLLVLNLQLITFAKSHSNCTRSLRFESSYIVVGILLSCFDQLFTAVIAIRIPVATLIFCRTHTTSE